MSSLSTQPTTVGVATGTLNAGVSIHANEEDFATLLNALLRSLRYSADVNSLRRAVHIFLQAAE